MRVRPVGPVELHVLRAAGCIDVARSTKTHSDYSRSCRATFEVRHNRKQLQPEKSSPQRQVHSTDGAISTVHRPNDVHVAWQPKVVSQRSFTVRPRYSNSCNIRPELQPYRTG